MQSIFKLFFKACLALALLDLAYISFLWFQRDVQAQGEIPVSRFIQAYVAEQQDNPDLPGLRWDPVPLASIPDRVARAFVIAEDAQFYVHNGLDINAIKSVLADGLSSKSISRGASTITQQTAKNLFLYPSRSWLRKWHELIFTMLLELTLDKQRILELYLNIAEFGLGVYGVNAASLYYFGLPVSVIGPRQASYLAAALPWPTRHNYKTDTKTFKAHARRIYSRSMKEAIPIQ